MPAARQWIRERTLHFDANPPTPAKAPVSAHSGGGAVDASRRRSLSRPTTPGARPLVASHARPAQPRSCGAELTHRGAPRPYARPRLVQSCLTKHFGGAATEEPVADPSAPAGPARRVDARLGASRTPLRTRDVNVGGEDTGRVTPPLKSSCHVVHSPVVGPAPTAAPTFDPLAVFGPPPAPTIQPRRTQPSGRTRDDETRSPTRTAVQNGLITTGDGATLCQDEAPPSATPFMHESLSNFAELEWERRAADRMAAYRRAIGLTPRKPRQPQQPQQQATTALGRRNPMAALEHAKALARLQGLAWDPTHALEKRQDAPDVVATAGRGSELDEDGRTGARSMQVSDFARASARHATATGPKRKLGSVPVVDASASAYHSVIDAATVSPESGDDAVRPADDQTSSSQDLAVEPPMPYHVPCLRSPASKRRVYAIETQSLAGGQQDDDAHPDKSPVPSPRPAHVGPQGRGASVAPDVASRAALPARTISGLDLYGETYMSDSTSEGDERFGAPRGGAAWYDETYREPKSRTQPTPSAPRRKLPARASRPSDLRAKTVVAAVSSPGPTGLPRAPATRRERTASGGKPHASDDGVNLSPPGRSRSSSCSEIDGVSADETQPLPWSSDLSQPHTPEDDADDDGFSTATGHVHHRRALDSTERREAPKHQITVTSGVAPHVWASVDEAWAGMEPMATTSGRPVSSSSSSSSSSHLRQSNLDRFGFQRRIRRRSRPPLPTSRPDGRSYEISEDGEDEDENDGVAVAQGQLEGDETQPLAWENPQESSLDTQPLPWAMPHGDEAAVAPTQASSVTEDEPGWPPVVLRGARDTDAAEPRRPVDARETQPSSAPSMLDLFPSSGEMETASPVRAMLRR